MVHSILATLQNLNELQFWENRPFSGLMPGPKQNKPEIKKPIKKKGKRNRTAFTTKQLETLELVYSKHKYVTKEQRQKISMAVSLGDRNIKIWFQNRRMKEKRESSEYSPVESDYSYETHSGKTSSSSLVASDCGSSDQDDNRVKEDFGRDASQYQFSDFISNNINTEIKKTKVGDESTPETYQFELPDFFSSNNLDTERNIDKVGGESTLQACHFQSPDFYSNNVNIDQNENKVEDKLIPEKCQLQLRNFTSNHSNDQLINNALLIDNNTLYANGMHLFSDNNMYPTSYYPYSNGNHTNNYNYYQNQQQSSMLNNYWSLNNLAPYYFYNE